MNKLCKLLNYNDEDELFLKITESFKEDGITKWDYFVNWNKISTNIKKIENELNLLNVLIGHENIETKLVELILDYPKVVNAIPFLLAIRFKKKEDQKFNILIDADKFIYQHFDFSLHAPNENEAKRMATFFVNSGLGDLVKDKQIKNLVDYVIGVEVGLDSNGRKNRGGTMMESIVLKYVEKTCKTLNLKFMDQATSERIKKEWDIDVLVDKSSRRIDFAINKMGKLYFIECNFYGGGGSKLKSTATEYIEMNEYWNKQKIEFIWITDGAGWKGTRKPLREYFDKADFLINLEMLKEDVLTKIVK